MSLSSAQLDAFLEVARSGSFSQGARNLHITQSALSQRIANLEGELMTSLLIREPSGLRLTPAGQQLLRYCTMRFHLETELLADIATGRSKLSGVVRIGGFSSIMSSVIIPSLADLIAQNPKVNIEFFSRELRELQSMLTRGEVDIIITTRSSTKAEVTEQPLGFEENVLAHRSHGNSRRVYLDHDADDTATSQFFAGQDRYPQKFFQRTFVDDVFSIIAGVKAGLGWAVLPLHLIQHEPDITVVKGLNPLLMPVSMQYFTQSYYSLLQQEVMKTLQRSVPMLLATRHAY